MSTITENISLVRNRIAAAALACGRSPEQVGLLAVSKTQPARAIEEAWHAGLHDLGENYLQEALEKQAQLSHLPLTWHFLGHIQSNKTRAVAEHFDWVHSVDRLRTARRLSDQRPPGRNALNICLQVNISGEASKSGCTPGELPELALAVEKLDNVCLRGLMVIPQPSDNIREQHAAFAQARQLLEHVNELLQHPMDTLSMGMSGDLEAAVAEGATWVRIGTAIFGARP
ncbi:MAG: YggS family pyridoxal phosphate-dependent enzyme [Gammaproteobacteria bacterium]|jgi:pyridoxal phosphate enzyme (YggS family)|nr:YggS family pyridoxal phosphate-dependent enzyme [Gammaproteobacteria bacterium]